MAPLSSLTSAFLFSRKPLHKTPPLSEARKFPCMLTGGDPGERAVSSAGFFLFFFFLAALRDMWDLSS